MNRYQEALDTIKRDYGLGSVSKKEFPTPEEVENAIKTLESAIILLEVLQEQLERSCKIGQNKSKKVL